MKILKKHDKLLGAREDRKREYLHNLLQQPFTSTESISKLVRAVEDEIRSLSPSVSDRETAQRGAREEIGAEPKEAKLLKRTRAALTMLEQLQQTAHTPSTLMPAATGTAAAAVAQDEKLVPSSKRHK